MRLIKQGHGNETNKARGMGMGLIKQGPGNGTNKAGAPLLPPHPPNVNKYYKWWEG